MDVVPSTMKFSKKKDLKTSILDYDTETVEQTSITLWTFLSNMNLE